MDEVQKWAMAGLRSLQQHVGNMHFFGLTRGSAPCHSSACHLGFSSLDQVVRLVTVGKVSAAVQGLGHGGGRA